MPARFGVPLLLVVPNAPCGVERRLLPKLAIVFPIRFLMYRMELKERLELSNDIILLYEASIREFIVGVDFGSSFWFRLCGKNYRRRS